MIRKKFLMSVSDCKWGYLIISLLRQKPNILIMLV